jgi:hypothetical protein
MRIDGEIEMVGGGEDEKTVVRLDGENAGTIKGKIHKGN